MAETSTHPAIQALRMAVACLAALLSLWFVACSSSNTPVDVAVQDTSLDLVDSATSLVSDAAEDTLHDIVDSNSQDGTETIDTPQSPELPVDVIAEQSTPLDLSNDNVTEVFWDAGKDTVEAASFDLTELTDQTDQWDTPDAAAWPAADIYSATCIAAFESGEDVIFVLAEADPLAPPDGSLAAPFTSLKAALGTAGPDALVCVGPGTYYGPLAISQTGLTLQGAGAEDTVVESELWSPGITVTASQVAVQGIGVSNGTSGIHFAGTETQPLSDCSVKQVAVRYLATGSDPPESVTGILVEFCDNALIENSQIAEMASGNGQGGGFTYLIPHAESATGVHLVHCNDCLISGNNVEQVGGGQGGTLTFDSHSEGGQGADAAGILLTQTQSCQITGNTVQDVLGGGSGTTNGTSIDVEDQEKGGDSHGIKLIDCANVALEENVVTQVHGTHDHKGESIACGIGIHLSSQVTLQANSISDIAGAKGKCHWHGNPNPNMFVPSGFTECSSGGTGAGIQATSSSSIEIEGSDLRTIYGGDRGDFPLTFGKHDHSGDGGDAIGLALLDVDSVIVENNLVATVAGGDGGDPAGDDAYGGHCGDGGSGAGLLLENLTEAHLSHTTIHAVSGGHGGTSVQTSTVCENGHATAVRLGAGPSISFANSIISEIAGNRCLDNDSALPKAQLEALWSNLHGCISPDGQTTLATDCLDVAPGYVDEPLDLHLLPDSPCIDSADPDAAFGAEPAPNGCRANMGAYGNTSEASVDLDAAHCPQQ